MLCFRRPVSITFPGLGKTVSCLQLWARARVQDAMDTYRQIAEARRVLDLPERATMEEIKSAYRRAVSRWHPDRCRGDREKCQEMTQEINAAYRVIKDYCANYQYSFAREEVENYISEEEWWKKRFGSGPLWDED